MLLDVPGDESTFLQFAGSALLLGPNTPLSITLFSNTLSLYSSRNLRDKISHSYKTNDIK
jgi:hypothetical protein